MNFTNSYPKDSLSLNNELNKIIEENIILDSEFLTILREENENEEIDFSIYPINLKLLYKLYLNDFLNFTRDELIILMNNLDYLCSKKLKTVLFLFKFNYKIDENLRNEIKFFLNNLNFNSKTLIGGAIEIGLIDIFEYLYDINDENNYNYIKLSTINLHIFTILYENIDKNLLSNEDRKEIIRMAIINGNLEILEILCDDKNLLNKEEKEDDDDDDDDYENNNPENNFAFLAIKNGHLEVLKFLLNFYNTYNFNIILYNNNNDNYMLEFAAEHNKFDIVKFLVKRGEDIHSKYNNALRNSINNKNIEISQFLIDNGSNINESQEDGEDGEEVYYLSNLDSEIEKKNINMVNFLLKNGAIITKYSLSSAINNNDLEMVKILLKNGADVNDTNGSDYHNLGYSINIGFMEYIELDPNISKPLISASDNKYLEIVNYLFDNGLNEISKNFHLLNCEIFNDNLEKVKEFIDNGTNFELANLFSRAIKNKSIKVINYFLENEIIDREIIKKFSRDLIRLNNLNIVENMFNLSKRLLFDCARQVIVYDYLSIDILKFLGLNLNVNIDITDKYGLISTAAIDGDIEKVKYLATYKFACISNMSFALINASDCDNIEMVNFLLDREVDDFSKNYHKMNVAIKNNDLLKITRLYKRDPSLIFYNNNVVKNYMIGNYSCTLSKAAKNGQIDIIKFLLSLDGIDFSNNIYEKFKCNFNKACVEPIKNNQIEKNFNFNNACLEAIKNNQFETTLYLIDNHPHKINPNYKYFDFKIPEDFISNLTSKESLNIIKYLIDNGIYDNDLKLSDIIYEKEKTL